MDEFTKKIEDLRKSLLSLKTNASKDLFVPAIKAPSLKTPSIKQPSISKLPGGLPPPSKKDPVKVAQQLKNPNPGKAVIDVLKFEDNGQWSLNKADGAFKTKTEGRATPPRAAKLAVSRAPVNAETESFPNHHLSEQNKLIHGLDIINTKPLGGSVAGKARSAENPTTVGRVVLKRASEHANRTERGHHEPGLSSAHREVLFHNLAHGYFGMGEHVPTTSGFSRDDDHFSAQDFKPNASHDDLKYEHDGFEEAMPGYKNEFKNKNHAKVLNNLHDTGALHKLALMDNIMGHQDRHSGNYMLEGKDKLHLVDNGTAFDYKNFDENAYPDHLRNLDNKAIKGMGKKDNVNLHPEAAKWLNELDPEKAKEILKANGHDENSFATQGFLRRLQGLKDSVNNGTKHYKNVANLLNQNTLTTGPKQVKTKLEPQW